MICLWLHFSALMHLGGSARVDKLEEVLLRTLGRNQPEPWANVNLETALKDQGELCPSCSYVSMIVLRDSCRSRRFLPRASGMLAANECSP